MRAFTQTAAVLAALLLALGLPLALPSAAGAGQAPIALTYRGGGRGPVIFDHQLHAARGYVCVDCHGGVAGGRQLFQTQKQALIDRAIHDADASCFACHNGKLAFDACNQCHRKP